MENSTRSSNVEQALEPCLELLESRATEAIGQLIPITSQGAVIGRSRGADVTINDDSISREHVRIRLLPDGTIQLDDLGSTNGTFVNGARVDQATLNVGDRIRAGDTLLQYVRETIKQSLRLNDVLATARVALWDWDDKSRRISTSPNFEEVTGISPSELSEEAIAAWIRPEDRERALRALTTLREGGGPTEVELLMARSDGGESWLAIKGKSLRSGLGCAITGSVSNITGRKRAERELRRLTLVLENLYDAIVVADLSGRITDWNAKAEATFGRNRDQAVGSSLDDLIGKQYSIEIRKALANREQWTGEIVIAREEAGDLVYEVAAAPLKDDDGCQVGLVAAFRDVTAKKALQNQLVMADKLAAIGTIAAGVAHEINNPLSFVAGGIDWVTQRFMDFVAAQPDADGIREVLQEMKDGVGRVATIVAGMKTFSRKEDGSPAAQSDLLRTVELAVRIVGNEARHHARLAIDVPGGLWIPANETRLMQVFINLIANAIHAIQDGDSGNNFIRIAVESRTTDSVTVTVTDSGIGMSKEALQRLFTPFYTTKAPARGTGLGLSVTRTILESLGGSISVDSVRGSGTTVTIKLPLAPAPQSPEQPAKPQRRAGRGTVLVIDDEQSVARAICRLLRSCGYEVEAAPDGRTGLELLLSRRFRVALCDIMMPDFSGVDLYNQVSATAPDLLTRLVFMSGGTFTARAAEFVASANRPMLTKPWSSETLIETVDAVLAEAE